MDGGEHWSRMCQTAAKECIAHEAQEYPDAGGAEYYYRCGRHKVLRYMVNWDKAMLVWNNDVVASLTDA